VEGKKARHWWNGLSRFRKPSEVSLCLPQLRYFFAHFVLTTYVKHVTAECRCCYLPPRPNPNIHALRSMNVGIRPCIVRGKYNRVQRIKLMLIIASFDGRISMELRHLATFRTLATTLNFTQTAALLGYVQSSVSAQIQELEAELGVLLFDRLNRRVILTDEGQRLLV